MFKNCIITNIFYEGVIICNSSAETVLQCQTTFYQEVTYRAFHNNLDLNTKFLSTI